MNFLLPHIRRMPHAIVRDEFAQDAAQKLGIDSAVLRQELKQAAAKRQGHIQSLAAANLSECERVLVRALAGPTESEAFPAGQRGDGRANRSILKGLGIYTTLRALAGRQQPDPLEAVGPAERTMVAQLLMREGEPVSRP